MGAVYRAVDQKFGSMVAIKETFYGDTELGEAFEREARLLNGLHHPILPHVSDSFTEDGGHFLVMEFIEGEDLSEILKRGAVLPVNTVLDWTLDILDGLDYLHSQNPPVIHRDIKPNNLKLTSRGKIVLLDFGMAKETTGNTIGTKSVFGYSRRYSPLEQIEGTGTDPRSDIFSLGASIYHLLTGQPPADVLARASAIVAGRPDPLLPASSINPDVPESVTEILNSALALNAENRLGSARAMQDALRSAIGTGLYRSENETVIAGAAIVPDDEAHAAVAVGDYADITSPLGGEVPVTSIGGSASSAAAAGSTSIPPMRIRRPSPLRYAVALPLVLLCLALVLFGTYRGFQSGAENPDVATEPAANAAAEATEIPAGLPEPETEDATDTVEINESSAPKADKEENVIVPSKPETARKTVAAPKQNADTESEPDPVRSSTRREQTKRSDGEARPRRVVKPAFEQPSVSSIEAIMTGVPYERRRRWEVDTMSEDELRRRRMRQMRRQQRREQPF